MGNTLADAPDVPLGYRDASFERLTGDLVDETVGRNCRFLQGPATAEEPVAAVREALEAAEPSTGPIYGAGWPTASSPWTTS